MSTDLLKKTKDESLTTLVGQALLIFGSSVYKAWVVTMLWTWFVVAVFGAPPIGIAVVLGLTLLVRFVGLPSVEFKGLDTFGEYVTASVVLSTIVFAAGYLVHVCV
jgi:hypothetical protein